MIKIEPNEGKYVTQLLQNGYTELKSAAKVQAKYGGNPNRRVFVKQGEGFHHFDLWDPQRNSTSINNTEYIFVENDQNVGKAIREVAEIKGYCREAFFQKLREGYGKHDFIYRSNETLDPITSKGTGEFSIVQSAFTPNCTDSNRLFSHFVIGVNPNFSLRHKYQTWQTPNPQNPAQIFHHMRKMQVDSTPTLYSEARDGVKYFGANEIFDYRCPEPVPLTAENEPKFTSLSDELRNGKFYLDD